VAVAGPRARSTVRVATAGGIGPKPRHGMNVWADAVSRKRTTVFGETKAVNVRAAARPKAPGPRVLAPKAGADAPWRAKDIDGPRGRGDAHPKTVSIHVGAAPKVSVHAAPTGKDRAAARTTLAQGGAAARTTPEIPVHVSTPHAQKGVAGPRGGEPVPRQGTAEAVAEAVVVPVRAGSTTVLGGSGSSPRCGSPPWSSVA